MKKSLLKVLYGVIAAASLSLACGEVETAMNQFFWTGGMTAIFFLSAKGMEKCMDEKEKEERV